MPAKLRVVLDTNLLVSALLFSQTPPRRAFSHAAHNGAILVSTETFGELENVLERSKFDRYVHRSRRREFLRQFASIADWVHVTATINASRDPRDNKFLELSLDGKADFLVTGDKDLLELAGSQNPNWKFQIVTPRDFLELVQQ